jgi:uncharacterized Zn finger protein
MSAVADWFVEKTLMDLAPPDVFLRGAEAAEHGSVHILEFDDAHLRAQVDDTEVYDVELHVEGSNLAWSCSCGAAKKHLCRHLVGAALATWPDEKPEDE